MSAKNSPERDSLFAEEEEELLSNSDQGMAADDEAKIKGSPDNTMVVDMMATINKTMTSMGNVLKRLVDSKAVTAARPKRRKITPDQPGISGVTSDENE